jgi:hypothetical protein
MILLVGLPGSGKTTVGKKLAREQNALRLTPDEWMIPLFGQPEADVDRSTQLERIERRWAEAPQETSALTSVDLDRWRAMFEVPTAAELAGSSPLTQPSSSASWLDWAQDR